MLRRAGASSNVRWMMGGGDRILSLVSGTQSHFFLRTQAAADHRAQADDKDMGTASTSDASYFDVAWSDPWLIAGFVTWALLLASAARSAGRSVCSCS